MQLLQECRRLAIYGLVVIEAVSLVRKLFGAVVLAVNAAPYFRWGDARQHVEVWSSGWTDVCYETGSLIQSCVDELAMRGTGADWTEIILPWLPTLA